MSLKEHTTEKRSPKQSPKQSKRSGLHPIEKRLGRRHKPNLVRIPEGTVHDPSRFSFVAHAVSSAGQARFGILTTPHGAIETPNFIFCATKGAIKAVSMEQMKAHGAEIILSNTYHLMLQPGADLIAESGGVHKFSNWDGPMLTDSGGYQIFAMGHGQVSSEIKGARHASAPPPSLIRMTEEGATFRSYTDGRHVTLTPEGAIAIQQQIGADLIVQLDECTPFHVSRDYTCFSTDLSTRWGDRCLAYLAQTGEGNQALYGVIQGGIYPDLRQRSAKAVAARPFFGTAVGGCLGATREQMHDVVALAMEHAPLDRPVHLLGIGGISDIFNGVRLGIDTFDCVQPTRIARHGHAIMPGLDEERINLRNACYRHDQTPLDETSPFPASRNYSRAYIHHLLKAKEMLGLQILTLHNVGQMMRLMRDIRAALKSGDLTIAERFWLAS